LGSGGSGAGDAARPRERSSRRFPCGSRLRLVRASARNRKERHLVTALELKPDGALVAPHEAEARVVQPLQFDDHTPPTSGMQRRAAVSGLLTGAEKLWAGVMLAEPNTASSVHHHGPLETVVYVVEGRSTLRWGRRLEHESELEAGDFLFVPPFVPHQEINP